MGGFIRSSRVEGSEVDNFLNIDSIAISTSDLMYMANFNNIQIRVFDAYGKFIRSWDAKGTEDRPEGYSGITIDPNGFIYVVGSHSGEIKVFDTTGKFIRSFGRTNEVSFKSGIAVSASDLVYVTSSHP